MTDDSRVYHTRPIGPQDHEAWLALVGTSRDTTSRARMPPAPASGHVILMCWLDEAAAVGCVEVELDRGIGTGERTARLGRFVLEDWADAPAVRESLLEGVLDWARARGVRALLGEVPADDEEGARALAALGFGAPTGIVRSRLEVAPAPLEIPSFAGPANAPANGHAVPAGGAFPAGGPVDTRGVVPGRGGSKLIHAMLIILGVTAILNTDIFSSDVIRGALLPIVDVVFVVYVVSLILLGRYRVRADATRRGEALFRLPEDG